MYHILSQLFVVFYSHVYVLNLKMNELKVILPNYRSQVPCHSLKRPQRDSRSFSELVLSCILQSLKSMFRGIFLSSNRCAIKRVHSGHHFVNGLS